MPRSYKLVAEELKRLKKQGKSIVLKPRLGAIYVGDYLRDIAVPEEFIDAINRVGRNIPEYSSEEIKNLAELIEFSKTFEVAISRIKRIEEFFHYTSAEQMYAFYLLNFLLEIQSITDKERRREPKFSYCCLCWREIASSHFYCSRHNPYFSPQHNACCTQLAKNNYYSDRRKLEYYAKYKNLKIPENRKSLPEFFYNFLGQFITAQRPIIERGNFSDTWVRQSQCVVEYCERHLPNTYIKISNFRPDLYDKISDWAIDVLYALENKSNNYSIELPSWISYEHQDNILRELLVILQRHEAYQQASDFLSRKRSLSNSQNKKQKIRRQIKSEIVKQLKKTGKTNYAEIGRKLKISRARVSKLAKELI